MLKTVLQYVLKYVSILRLFFPNTSYQMIYSM